MAYITREDGVHFVVPSYRDVLTFKQKSQLKKDILLLSQSYGGYITMQKKGSSQYEVAFAPDTGYLLGESVWNHFKRPMDMIFCEQIPNTKEAILVIVKNGGVYLDGSFPLENIAEELVIFLTQENNFEIYVDGDVPISQTPTEGKFSFEPSSVKSFTVLDKPAFPSVPLVKAYQLQLVEATLKAQGIGALPIKPVLALIVLIGVGYFFYTTVLKPPPPPPPVVVNPYQGFNDTLNSPAPDEEVTQFVQGANTLLTIPGWILLRMDYSSGNITSQAASAGGKVEDLFAWAKANNVTVGVTSDGVTLNMSVPVPNKRGFPKKIYPLDQVVAQYIDLLAQVYPGNNIKLDSKVSSGQYSLEPITVNLTDVSPDTVMLIGQQLQGLPMVLSGISVAVTNGSLSGTMTLNALGS